MKFVFYFLIIFVIFLHLLFLLKKLTLKFDMPPKLGQSSRLYLFKPIFLFLSTQVAFLFQLN